MHEKSYSLDSHLSLEEMVAQARKLGLDGLCITDHDSMFNSIKMSALAVAMGLVLTLPAAYLGRRSPSPLLRTAEALLMLPWCVPASVIAINLINVFNVPSIFAFGKPLIGTFIILPIAYAIAALPLLLNAGRIALSGVSADTEEASRSLGAGPLGTFARIVLPALTPGVLSGAILVFVRTMKPVRLFAYQVANSTLREAVVLDLFAGSGTTAIACEQLGRAAYLMESDPRFVDVIIRRWEAFTGEKAVLLNAS